MRTSVLGATSRVARPDLVERMAGWISDQGPHAVAWAQRAMAARPDRTHVLEAFAGPAVVVVGEEDEISPVDVARAMADRLRDGELVVVPRAGHMTSIESPQPVASALSRLLRRAEAAQARAMIAEFVAEARRRGVPPQRLHARSYDGRQRYRTPLHGWYLRKNRTVAVGTDGQFYVLSVPPRLRSLVTGATPEPSDPPLVLGKGARDGESIDLADALRIALGDPPRR